jgi:hypothetical protein
MLHVQLSLPRAKSARRLTWYFLLSSNLGPPPTLGRKLSIQKNLAFARDDFADVTECCEAELLRPREPVLDLGCEHIAIEIAAGLISSELVVCAVDAVGIERGLATCSADEQVVGKYLILPEASIFVECESVGLEGVFAAQRLGEEVRCELRHHSGSGVKMVGASVAIESEAQGTQGCVKPEVGWRNRRFAGARPQCNDRISSPDPRSKKELPSDSAQCLIKEELAGLIDLMVSGRKTGFWETPNWSCRKPDFSGTKRPVSLRTVSFRAAVHLSGFAAHRE